MRVVTHIVFAEACWFVTAAIFDVHYELPSVAAAAVAGVLPDADYPKSWTGRMLGSVSEDLHRFFGHRSFLHSYLALTLVTATVGLLLWWLLDRPAPLMAVFVGYGSHILADMMTVGGVQFFWPSRVIAVFPGRDEYRVLSGSTSECVFVALALVFALLFYPVSKVGFDGLIYRMGGAETPYATVVEVLDGDTVKVDTQGSTVDVRLMGVDTPETIAPDHPIGCYGPEASEFTRKTLPGKPPEPAPGEILPTGTAPSPTTGRVVKLEVPRIGDSEDAYGRTLAYVWIDQDGDGSYEHLLNEDLLRLGYARTTSFAHTYSRRFLALEDEAREAGVGLWGACRTPAESRGGVRRGVTDARSRASCVPVTRRRAQVSARCFRHKFRCRKRAF